MKKTISTLIVTSAVLLSACSTATQKNDGTDYTAYVNPFIGTDGHGHTFPGAVVPHGMIQPSPDTRIDGWDACSGYHYSDSTINGFSQTHLSGTGCADYGDILIMPTVGEQVIHPQDFTLQALPYASGFSHERETAEPGYYSVWLERYKVQTEITSTARAALYRFTYPAEGDAGLIIDLDYSIQRQKNRDMILEVVNDTEVRGHKITGYWAFDQVINFHMTFSEPFTHTLVTDTIYNEKGEPYARKKAILKFKKQQPGTVFAKVSVSTVDMEGAKKNLVAEIPAWDFDGVRNAAKTAWNKYLSKIEIDTDSKEDKTTFYTAMYHTAISPNLFTDVDGRYLGMNLKVRQGDAQKPIYTIFSLWDTFRALHPLLTIIDPDLNNRFIHSLLTKQQEGGIFPMWELAGNYTGTMIGYHAVSLIADAYTKGISDFDLQQAYKACLRSAEYDTTGISCPPPVLPHLMPKSKYYKNSLGYVPCDTENETVAKALEYAYNDFCIAVLAEAANDKANAEKYNSLAKAYKNYFDTSVRFMRGKDLKKQWRTPFDPRSSNHRNDDYCEGNAWQWTWFVPQDVEGLVKLMGGREAFIDKLDSLFTISSELTGELVSADISGLIGQYAHGNEPSHHVTHLYNYVDQPWRTQELVDSVLREQYRPLPDGLTGNEDCGQMSAWYVLNAMGFYQVCPGKPVYSIGRPLFNRSVIHLKDGKTFAIEAKNNSRKNKYVVKAELNGKPLEKPFFNHQDIVNGGTLVLTMGDKPTAWNE